MTNAAYNKERRELIELVPYGNHRVLDLGCACGVNGERLLEEGRAAFVCGCEIDGEMAAAAATKLSRVYQGDITKIIRDGEIEENDFDYIILGDVLEHLVHPLQTLARVVESYLGRDGHLILSVPNVQHVETFIQVYIHGRWPRNSKGLFDRTHLHQFTERTLREDLDSVGLEIKRLSRVFRRRDLSDKPFPRIVGRLLTTILPNLFTMQFVVVSGRRN